MQTIVFQVPDAVAAEMHDRSVYLDVFGIVRWSENYEAVEGATPWVSAPAVSTMRDAMRSSPDSGREADRG